MYKNLVTTSSTRRIDFEIHDVLSSIPSGIRRSIIADVQTVAFLFDSTNPQQHDIRVLKNTGALHNEFICDRLSLVPLHLSKDEIAKFRPDAWRFDIAVHSKPASFTDVTTSDIKLVSIAPTELKLSANKVFPADPVTKDHILIARLKPEKRGVREEIVLEATARAGSGREHARWSPVCNCVSIPLPDHDAIQKARESADDKHRFDTIDSKQLYISNKFKFSIESCCGMTPKEIFESGIESLQARFIDLGRSFASQNTNKLKVLKEHNKIVSIQVLGESDTSFGILQQWLFDKVDFIGYYIPHMSQNAVVLAIKTKDNQDVFSVLEKACIEISKFLSKMLNEWVSQK